MTSQVSDTERPPHPPEHTADCDHDSGRYHGFAPAWVPAALVGLLGVGACIALNVRDPNGSGSWGYCPSRVLFGVDCPGCGLLRGTHALTNGDVATALDHNVLVLPVLGIIAYAYLRWAGDTVGVRLPRFAWKTWHVAAIVVVMVAFFVVRNLGGSFDYLAATAG